MSELPAVLRARVLRAAAELPSPTRAEVWRRRRWLATVGALVVVAGAFMRGVPSASSDRPLLYIVLSGASALLAAVLGSALLFTRRNPAIGPSKAFLGKSLVVGPGMALLGVLGATLAALDMGAGSPDGQVLDSKCVSVHLAIGVILLALAVASLGKGDPVAPRATGAAAGAMAGSWASFVLALQCPGALMAHALPNHIAPVALLVTLGVALGERWLGVDRPRSRLPLRRLG